MEHNGLEYGSSNQSLAQHKKLMSLPPACHRIDVGSHSYSALRLQLFEVQEALGRFLGTFIQPNHLRERW
jgi:hypothetical protein